MSDRVEMKPEREDCGNVAVVTMGCAKNTVDSEVMLGAFLQKGYRPIEDPALADIILVNTCAFLQSAVEEGIDCILELSQLKKEGRCRRLIVAGCMVERYRSELSKSLPEVDVFVSTDELALVAQLGETTEKCLDEARRPYFLYDDTFPRVLSSESSVYVKIAEGCDRPCSFCIIPRIRGGFRSRTANSVVAEVQALLHSGVKEINLVAQDLTAYGRDLGGDERPGDRLVLLLKSLDSCGAKGQEFWLRLLYAYPLGVTDELLLLLENENHICPYLDIPLQHISSSVLKLMRRPLGEKGTRKLVERIRKLAPSVALRTTFLTGFPGETEADVELLLSFIKEGHFAHVGVFSYSPEAEAQAAAFSGEIPASERESRRARLLEAQQGIAFSRAESLVGQRFQVLVDGYHAESDLLLSGRSSTQAPETDGCVILNEVADELLNEENLDSLSRLIGRFVMVECVQAAGYDVVAKICSVV